VESAGSREIRDRFSTRAPLDQALECDRMRNLNRIIRMRDQPRIGHAQHMPQQQRGFTPRVANGQQQPCALLKDFTY
jgi:hypothetical protein